MSGDAFVVNASGIKIAVTRLDAGRGRAVIIAPGFFTSKDTRTYRRIAADLHKHFDVISMDFRGHGKSGGLYTFSAREPEDLKAVIDSARTRYAKIGVLGFSYGGAIAILEAAKHQNVDSLVCISSPMASEQIEFQWWRPEAVRLGLLKFEIGNGVRCFGPWYKTVKPIDVVASVSCPTLFIHGTNDPTVFSRHSRMLFDAAPDPKKLVIIEKGSHAEELYRRFPERLIDEVVAHFSHTLQ